MRITIAHKKTKAQAIQEVDRAIDDALKGLAAGPITISDLNRSWDGSVLTFAMMAKVGILRNPIRGTVEVTDADVTIDADLGMLSKLFPQERFRTALESRVRGVLT